jgi:hypothetical protein
MRGKDLGLSAFEVPKALFHLMHEDDEVCSSYVEYVNVFQGFTWNKVTIVRGGLFSRKGASLMVDKLRRIRAAVRAFLTALTR